MLDDLESFWDDHLYIFCVLREHICDLSLMQDLNCGVVLRTYSFDAKLIWHDGDLTKTLFFSIFMFSYFLWCNMNGWILQYDASFWMMWCFHVLNNVMLVDMFMQWFSYCIFNMFIWWVMIWIDDKWTNAWICEVVIW